MSGATAAALRAAKRRGADAEQAVCDWLAAHGYPYAERRRLRGTLDRGDVAGVPGLVIEVKAEARIDLPGYLREAAAEKRNAGAACAVVLVQRRGSTDVGGWYCVLTAADFFALWGDR